MNYEKKDDSIRGCRGEKASARKDYDYVKSLEGKDKLKSFLQKNFHIQRQDLLLLMKKPLMN